MKKAWEQGDVLQQVLELGDTPLPLAGSPPCSVLLRWLSAFPCLQPEKPDTNASQSLDTASCSQRSVLLLSFT